MTQAQRLLQFLQDYKPHNTVEILREVQNRKLHVYELSRRRCP
jgi:hypothetical protein